MKKFVFILILFIFASAAEARVWTVKKTGGDFDSIQLALGTVATGDAIQIEAATFAENVTVQKSVTLEGGFDQSTWQKTGKTTVTPGNISFLNAESASIEGFITDVITVNDSSSVQIDNCTLTSDGFTILNSSNVSIRDCTVSGVVGVGINAWGVNGLYCHNNTITGNNNGASVKACGDIEMSGNNFSDNSTNGLYINNCQDLYFHDNLVNDNGAASFMAGYGFELRRTSGILARNTVTGNNWCAFEIWDTPVPSLGNINSIDPRDVGQNKIYNNGGGIWAGNNLIYGAPVTLYAQNNDWGTTDILLIDRRIYDDEEDPVNNGKVEFLPVYQVRQMAANNVLIGPNPFCPGAQTLHIKFDLLTAEDIVSYVFDASGNLVWKNVYSGSAGANTITWNGATDFGPFLQNGVYLVKLVASGKVVGSSKIVVLN